MVESADDRLFMLQDFGVDASFRASGTGSKTIKVIYDNAYEAVDAGGTVEFALQQPRITCRSSDVDGVAEGDSLTIGSDSFLIRVIMPDGTGITEMMLEKQ